MSRTLITAALWVSGGILLGRLAGFMREVSIAAHFGASAEADLVIAALSLPDVLVNLLMGGALSATLIPAFSKADGYERSQLFMQACLVASIATAVIALLLGLFPAQILKLLAPGLQPSMVSDGIPLARTLVWVVPLTVLAGLTTSRLHALSRFGVASMGTLIFNLCIILGIYIFASFEKSEIWWIGLAALAGGSLRLASQAIAIRTDQVWKFGMLHPWKLNRGFLTDYLRALIAGGLLFLLPICGRALASLDGPGQLTAFNLATKLIELPLGACISIFAVVLFPKLSKMYVENYPIQNLTNFIAKYFTIILLIGIWIGLPLMWFRFDFTFLLYGWGRMGENSLATIATLVGFATISLPLQGASSLLVAVYLSRKDTKTPLNINLIGVAMFAFIGFLLEQTYGIIGVIISIVLSYGMILALQIVFLSKIHGTFILREVRKYRLPTILSLNALVILILGNITTELRMGSIFNVFIGTMMPLVLFVTTYLMSPEIRKEINSFNSFTKKLKIKR